MLKHFKFLLMSHILNILPKLVSWLNSKEGPNYILLTIEGETIMCMYTRIGGA